MPKPTVTISYYEEYREAGRIGVGAYEILERLTGCEPIVRSRYKPISRLNVVSFVFPDGTELPSKEKLEDVLSGLNLAGLRIPLR